MPPLLVTRAFNLLGKPFGINPFPRAHVNASAHGDRCETFDSIYRENAWHSKESFSGPGSEASRTAAYVSSLENLLKQRDLTRIFDAPCGDLNWILPAMTDRVYIGGDIAPTLINDLRKRHPDIDLRVFDICIDPFPEADVWHCRDCLFHLPFEDIQRALRNFSRSKIPFALLTSHRTRVAHRNVDVPVGGWRYLDLQLAPISLPKPLAYLRDYRLGRDFPRYVGLWGRDQILASL